MRQKTPKADDSTGKVYSNDGRSLTRTYSTLPALPRSAFESVQKLIDGSRADATRRGYAYDFKTFERWCTAEGLEPIPLQQPIVIQYLLHLYTIGRKVKTIERAFAGIVFKHRKSGYDWESSHNLLETLGGIRRTRRLAGETITKKAAITKDLLVRMLETVNSGSLSDVRARALLLLTWTACARRSEIAELHLSDVEFTPEGMIIRPRKTKTDQEGKHTEKGIPLASDPKLCATRAVETWLTAAGIQDGPLFRGFDLHGNIRTTRMTSQVIANVVKSTCEKAGIDPKNFSGHSLRAGFITEAAERDIPEAQIMTQSHHRNVAELRGYIRHADLFKKNVTKGLL